jgi:hypothetical protein
VDGSKGQLSMMGNLQILKGARNDSHDDICNRIEVRAFHVDDMDNIKPIR